MIQFLLLQNRQGKTRLSKYYKNFSDSEKTKMETEIHRTVTTRDPKFTNFVEYQNYKLIYRRYAGLFFTLCVVRARRRRRLRHLPPACRTPPRALSTLASRHPPLAFPSPLSLPLASMALIVGAAPRVPFALFAQDVSDNELLYFESIHLFVELLDQFFGNVCELDLVFNFNKVYMILDEFFLAGEVQETSKQAILHRVQELDKLD